MKYFDIKEELYELRTKVIIKHPNLSEEVKKLELDIKYCINNNSFGSHYQDYLSKAIALKEIIIKIRIDPEEANSKYLINKLNEMIKYSQPKSITKEKQ